jgi:hypothetical protein
LDGSTTLYIAPYRFSFTTGVVDRLKFSSGRAARSDYGVLLAVSRRVSVLLSTLPSYTHIAPATEYFVSEFTSRGTAIVMVRWFGSSVFEFRAENHTVPEVRDAKGRRLLDRQPPASGLRLREL